MEDPFSQSSHILDLDLVRLRETLLSLLSHMKNRFVYTNRWQSNTAFLMTKRPEIIQKPHKDMPTSQKSS